MSASVTSDKDPCPGCRPNTRCRTPSCGRLKQDAEKAAAVLEAADDWGGLSDDDIEELAAKPVLLINPAINHVWVTVYMITGSSIPMTMTGQDRDDVIKWTRQNNSLDRTQPIKLYRLEY